MSNLGLSKFCEEHNINFIKAKGGDRYVLEKMLEGWFMIGSEQSGHIILRKYSTTGDGQLAAVKLAEILKLKNKKLEELSSLIKKFPQKFINIKVSEDKKQKILSNKEIVKILDKTKKILGQNGRVLLRASGTEPLIRLMVEWNDEKNIDSLALDISRKIKKLL